MGANNHPTVQPENWEPPMATQRENLVADLQALDAVTSAEDVGFGTNTVQFTCEGPMPGDIPSSVLHVLADHGAMLPSEQPDDANDHHAYIELDN